MSNEDLPQSAEMASAYLDGELDGPERAAAAADPQVMSTLDSYARVRAVLGEIGPVDPTAKSTAIAAALAEFDAMHSPGSSSTMPAATATAPVVSLQSRRHRTYRVISGVAAAAIVGVIARGNQLVRRPRRPGVLVGNSGARHRASGDFSRPEGSGADAGAATEAAPEATDAAASADGSGIAAAPAIDTPAALTEYVASVEAKESTTAAAPAGTAAPTAAEAPAATSPAAATPSIRVTPSATWLAPAQTSSSSVSSSTAARRRSPCATSRLANCRPSPTPIAARLSRPPHPELQGVSTVRRDIARR